MSIIFKLVQAQEQHERQHQPGQPPTEHSHDHDENIHDEDEFEEVVMDVDEDDEDAIVEVSFFTNLIFGYIRLRYTKQKLANIHLSDFNDIFAKITFLCQR